MNDKTDWEDELIKLIIEADQTENTDQAIKLYMNCLSVIPDPVRGSIYSTQLNFNLGEIYFQKGDYSNAFDYFSECLKCKGGLGTPAIHLRLGQIRFESGDMDRAKDEFIRAYMGSGRTVFEFEDPKYFALIKEII